MTHVIPAPTPREVPGDFSPPFSNIYVKILQFSALAKGFKKLSQETQVFPVWRGLC